jgi:hypothetical protein
LSSSASARTTDITRERISGGALSCGTALSSASPTKLSSSTFAAQTWQPDTCAA